VRPIIISIPHASTKIPDALKDNVLLTGQDILANCDLYTDRVYSIANTYVVKCEVPRMLLDVNRAPDDISKEYEDGKDGVVLHTTWEGKHIYKKQPTEKEVNDLIKKYHDPFHEEIDSYIPAAQFLIDCHSYVPIGPPTKPDAGRERPDVNIGNMNYSTCTREHTLFFREFFERHGYSVAINFPYQGRYILGRHCHRRRIPHFLVPGIQIELNQKLYSDPITYAPNEDGIKSLNTIMQKVVEEFLGEFVVE
jgi:N-formylglutamate amidohydrolase